MRSRDDTIGAIMVAALIAVFIAACAVQEPPGRYLKTMSELDSE